MASSIGAKNLQTVPVFRLVSLCLTMLAFLVLPVGGQEVSIVQNDVLERPFPYRADEVEIGTVLLEMTQKTDVPVIASEEVGGRVTLSDPDGSLRDVLNDMAGQGRIAWWFDGVAVHVEPAGSVISRLIGLDGVSIAELRGQMRELGLSDPQYQLRAGAEAEMIRVVAPQGYIDAVSELVGHMASARSPDAGPKGLPTIIRGNGWRHNRVQ